MKNQNGQKIHKQIDWTMVFFRLFWALAEWRSEKEAEPELITKSFSDFWFIIHRENVGDGQEMSGGEPEPVPDPTSDEDSGPEEEFSSLQHFAELYILKADQRYLLREIQINEGILQDQERRLGESKRKIQSLELQRCRLAKLRKKMEMARNHRVLGSFTQFWQHIEDQVETDEEGDYLEYLGDFFRLISKSHTSDRQLPLPKDI